MAPWPSVISRIRLDPGHERLVAAASGNDTHQYYHKHFYNYFIILARCQVSKLKFKWTLETQARDCINELVWAVHPHPQAAQSHGSSPAEVSTEQLSGRGANQREINRSSWHILYPYVKDGECWNVSERMARTVLGQPEVIWWRRPRKSPTHWLTSLPGSCTAPCPSSPRRR